MSMPPPPVPLSARCSSARKRYEDNPASDRAKLENEVGKGGTFRASSSARTKTRAVLLPYYNPWTVRDELEDQRISVPNSNHSHRSSDQAYHGDVRRHTWPNAFAVRCPSCEDQLLQVPTLRNTTGKDMDIIDFHRHLCSNGLDRFTTGPTLAPDYRSSMMGSPTPFATLPATRASSTSPTRWPSTRQGNKYDPYHLGPSTQCPDDDAWNMTAHRPRSDASESTISSELAALLVINNASARVVDEGIYPVLFDPFPPNPSAAAKGKMPVRPDDPTDRSLQLRRRLKLEARARRAQHTRVAKRLQNEMARNEVRFEQRPGVNSKLAMVMAARMEMEMGKGRGGIGGEVSEGIGERILKGKVGMHNDSGWVLEGESLQSNEGMQPTFETAMNGGSELWDAIESYPEE